MVSHGIGNAAMLQRMYGEVTLLPKSEATLLEFQCFNPTPALGSQRSRSNMSNDSCSPAQVCSSFVRGKNELALLPDALLWFSLC